MPGIDLVVLDLDGTVADSFDDIASSMNVALAAVSRPPLPAARIRGFVGNGVARLIERTAPDAGGDERKAIASAFRAHYGANLCVQTRLYPGVAEALSRLAAGRLLALASNKPEAWCRTILARLGVLHLFAAVVGGDTFPYRKPDPRLLLDLLARLQTPPDRTVMVGDSETDAETARTAGVRFVGVTTGTAGAADLRALGATHVLDGLGILPQLLAEE